MRILVRGVPRMRSWPSANFLHKTLCCLLLKYVRQNTQLEALASSKSIHHDSGLSMEINWRTCTKGVQTLVVTFTADPILQRYTHPCSPFPSKYNFVSGHYQGRTCGLIEIGGSGIDRGVATALTSREIADLLDYILARRSSTGVWMPRWQDRSLKRLYDGT